ncbi:MAG TPA: 6-phosphogluconolactonase [Cyclobacteriaceae bacterium]|nr:6-phosphogluconolactonase [Cyclobacteriaceae bacterium]
MEISISTSWQELGQKAAALAITRLKDAITQKGCARILLATGMSQMETMQRLADSDVDWSSVEVFHMDEYIGLPPGHKASFIKYIQERFTDKVKVKKFYPVETSGDLNENLKQLSITIRESQVDVGMIGIGENTHIGFNDPPADFETREAYIQVKLDDRCKLQQVGEGWFASIDEVPDTAVTITPYQILQCQTIICSVPYLVKADAIHKTITSKISEDIPSTILKKHDDFHLFLDRDSASRIIQF